MTKHHWIKLTSWGCVQVLFIILTILLFPAPGGALEPVSIDLLAALNLHNTSQHEGVSITEGYRNQRIATINKIAYHLQGKERNLILPVKTYHEAVELIRKSTDFTIIATVKQEESNSGAIVAFSYGHSRFLELSSSGRKDEIRFMFNHLAQDGQLQQHTENFSYRLADNTWHKIALTISGTEIQLMIDCHPLYKRVTHFIPDRNFSASNMQLFIGQRTHNNYLFKGDLQDVHLIPGPYGYLKQCENMDAQCPTCGQFLQLQNALVELNKSFRQLTQRLEAAEDRVSYLEECECKKSCSINGTTKEDGAEWNNGCTLCKCKRGRITCEPTPCAEVKCKNPVLKDGQCCPICLKNCYLKKTEYEHGETHYIGCRKCKCHDGSMNCPALSCPELPCPEDQQFTVTEGCCKYCKGVDYCSNGHACHTNATCLNLNTKYTCTCRPGFQGDGFQCSDSFYAGQHHSKPTTKKTRRRRTHHGHQHTHHRGKRKNEHLGEDIDECAQKGGLNGNHCHSNTKCVNTFGSYVCECLPGYRSYDKFNCIEVDECATGQHSCHENADCINTQGSYHCKCKENYIGDGIDCKPICNQTCLNGGECLSPGVCTCKIGYVGASCEKDLDECTTGFHHCNDKSVCVNMPGWYFCHCKPGYETIGNDCVDIDECSHRTHSCHPSARCVNTEGHFECQCTENEGPDCRLSCMYEDNEIPDGKTISPRNQPCKQCTCSRGVISCVEPQCNCSLWRRGSSRDLCCPQCDPDESCRHQELPHVTFRSGEQWIYQCQTCECLYGEYDCWKLECPPLACDNPLPLAPGDCCPRCPEDILCSSNSTITGSKSCSYGRHTYPSGHTFRYPSRDCATCTCKDGKITCRYDNHCTDDELHQNQKFITHDSAKVSNFINESSKATTSAGVESGTTASQLSSPTTNIVPSTSTTATSTANQQSDSKKTKREVYRQFGN